MLPVLLEALGTTLWENPRGQRLRSCSHTHLRCRLTAPHLQGLHWGGQPGPRLSPTRLRPLPSVWEPLCLVGGVIRESQWQESCPTDQCDGRDFHSQPSFLPVCPEWPPSLQFLVTGNKHWVAVSPSPSLSVRTGVGKGQKAQPPSPSIPPRETPGWGPSEEEPDTT